MPMEDLRRITGNEPRQRFKDLRRLRIDSRNPLAGEQSQSDRFPRIIDDKVIQTREGEWANSLWTTTNPEASTRMFKAHEPHVGRSEKR